MELWSTLMLARSSAPGSFVIKRITLGAKQWIRTCSSNQRHDVGYWSATGTVVMATLKYPVEEATDAEPALKPRMKMPFCR